MPPFLTQLSRILQNSITLANSQSIASIQEKSFRDYVTNVDFTVDKFLTQELQKLTPNIKVLSEERVIEGAEETFWIIDPIDGTHNLLSGIPIVGISAALFEGHVLRASAVADIHRAHVFSAQKEAGAFLNGHRLRVPNEPPSLVAVSTGAMDCLIESKEAYKALRSIGKLRNLGSQALHICYVASGVFSTAISFEAKFWDDAAASLIAAEAGASYQSFSGITRRLVLDSKLSTNCLRSICAHPSTLKASQQISMRLSWAEEELNGE
ncbi:myo-inositol-1(or 4)-monophosphatase [Pseudovibrio ascidiaceicola]|uniref:Myo-inositol-1(Or 4)-monophosphatase n=1 Tax=Pseudovibrio ascidiaceicola TaxID=285279 RepID=A0A1I3VHN7_9HYPH|nr:inositol monophosphatase [Pseudovibrio ascidiaceicola]SFJ94559.1 myo-inositol-1(or 4)-monophosphatase [Pseudovibrio ascidiaceicola]